MFASKSSGFSLLETVAVSAFLAVSSMGLGSALISGTALTEKAHRRMSQVATAENIMEQIRQASNGDLPSIVTEYDGVTTAARSSMGFTNDTKRLLTVRVPLSESSVPGGIDLNANGDVDTVDPADARLLVVDIEGADKLRLRTAVLDLSKLTGISANRERNQGEQPVAFGETYDENGETITPPHPPPPPPPTVNTVATDMNGNSAQLVLLNVGTESRTIVSVTVAPEKDTHYFEGISINGALLFESPVEQEPGTVTVEPESSLPLAPGEATLEIGDFYKIDKGTPKAETPARVAITIVFDDGSVVTAVVSN